MKDLFKEIWSSLRQNKLRTALTGFSVSWGIFMIIVLLGSGRGLMNALLESDSRMDKSMKVYPGYTTMPYKGYQSGRRIALDEMDLKNIRSEQFSENVREVSPSLNQNITFSFGEESLNMNVRGVTDEYSAIEGVSMKHGRFINENDMKEKAKHMVISDEDALTFLGGKGNPEDMIGKRLTGGSLSWLVTGIYHTDHSQWGHNAYAPYSLIRELYGKANDIGTIIFSFEGLDDKDESAEFKDTYKNMVLANHKASPADKGAFYISDRFEQGMQMKEGMKIINTALWVLGFLTLISGIVGVSNIMLITVKERKHEFGIRKALGARPAEILKLVMAESVLITAFFGYVGMFLGMVANIVMDNVFSGKATEVAGEVFYIFKDPGVGLDVALKATLLLIVAGAVAGLIPARKASRVMPVEALKGD
ncbi:MAG: ABC transporter permease [Bacteroidales bacterium]|nr:ABC transporter permease [Bacteroidales bacterium]